MKLVHQVGVSEGGGRVNKDWVGMRMGHLLHSDLLYGRRWVGEDLTKAEQFAEGDGECGPGEAVQLTVRKRVETGVICVFLLSLKM